MPPITYLGFLFAFVIAPVVVLSSALVVTRRWHPAQLFGIALLAGVALLYTLPWDAQLIRVGVWRYGTTLVGRLGSVPYEEVLFIVAQTVLTGLWAMLVVRPDGAGPAVSRRQRIGGVVAGVVVVAIGLLGLSRPELTYLGAILVWAGPVLALQWGFGWPVLLRRRRSTFVALAVPTAYLWIIDRLAIGLGLWTFSPEYTTGLALLGLPIEEGLFFLVTNLFLVQGLVLFGWVVERDVLLTVADALRTAPKQAE